MEKQTDSKEKQKTPQEFAAAYQSLCSSFGYQLAFVPQWKQSLDTGVFGLTIKTAIVKLEEKKEGN